MRLRRLTAILAMLGLLIGPSGGCLSLSMLNREPGDTRQRLDSLEQRVSALEAGGVRHPDQPIVAPGPPLQSPQASLFGDAGARR